MTVDMTIRFNLTKADVEEILTDYIKNRYKKETEGREFSLAWPPTDLTYVTRTTNAFEVRAKPIKSTEGPCTKDGCGQPFKSMCKHGE